MRIQTCRKKGWQQRWACKVLIPPPRLSREEKGQIFISICLSPLSWFSSKEKLGLKSEIKETPSKSIEEGENLMLSRSSKNMILSKLPNSSRNCSSSQNSPSVKDAWELLLPSSLKCWEFLEAFLNRELHWEGSSETAKEFEEDFLSGEIHSLSEIRLAVCSFVCGLFCVLVRGWFYGWSVLYIASFVFRLLVNDLPSVLFF